MPEKKQVEHVGKKIKEIRAMTEEEMAFECWEGDRPAIIIVLEDGTKFYPSRDEEGNGPGALFGRKGKVAFRLD